MKICLEEEYIYKTYVYICNILFLNDIISSAHESSTGDSAIVSELIGIDRICYRIT